MTEIVFEAVRQQQEHVRLSVRCGEGRTAPFPDDEWCCSLRSPHPTGMFKVCLESLLRRFLSKHIPACLSFRPPSAALHHPLHSLLCAGWRALKAYENPTHSGTCYSGNRLSAAPVPSVPPFRVSTASNQARVSRSKPQPAIRSCHRTHPRERHREMPHCRR